MIDAVQHPLAALLVEGLVVLVGEPLVVHVAVRPDAVVEPSPQVVEVPFLLGGLHPRPALVPREGAEHAGAVVGEDGVETLVLVLLDKRLDGAYVKLLLRPPRLVSHPEPLTAPLGGSDALFVVGLVQMVYIVALGVCAEKAVVTAQVGHGPRVDYESVLVGHAVDDDLPHGPAENVHLRQGLGPIVVVVVAEDKNNGERLGDELVENVGRLLLVTGPHQGGVAEDNGNVVLGPAPHTRASPEGEPPQVVSVGVPR